MATLCYNTQLIMQDGVFVFLIGGYIPGTHYQLGFVSSIVLVSGISLILFAYYLYKRKLVKKTLDRYAVELLHLITL